MNIEQMFALVNRWPQSENSYSIPLLLSLWLGLLVGLIAWEFWLALEPWAGIVSVRKQDSVLWAFLLLAGLAVGLLLACTSQPYGF